MKHRRLLLLLIALPAFCLGGCRQEPVLVVIDPWFEFLLSGDFSRFNLDRELKISSLTDLKHDYYRITVKDPVEAQATLDKYGAENRIFLISPLVYLWTRQVVLPQERIVILDGSSRWAGGGKSCVWSDTAEAMEQAGIWAGRLTAGNENTVAAGIIAGNTPPDETGFNRFKAGYATEAPEATLLVLPVNTAPEEAAGVLIKMTEGKSVGVWFLFAGTANIAGLAALNDREEPVICQEGGPYLATGVVAASVDSDRPAILREGLKMVKEGRFGEARSVPARFRPVKVKKK